MPPKILFKRSNSGFTLLEALIVVVILAILAAIAIPSWLSFIETRRLNIAQDQVYRGLRQAQSRATKEKITIHFSIRHFRGNAQWAIHPATVRPTVWNEIDHNLRYDWETTLKATSGNIGVRHTDFDFRGTTTPPFGRITLSSKSGGKTKRCVFVSTYLGALRTAKEKQRPDNGRYCY